MSNMRVLYPRDNNKLAIIIPANSGLTVEQVAERDVPQGQPYLIVNKDDLPSDYSSRELWEADFSNPDGYGGS